MEPRTKIHTLQIIINIYSLGNRYFGKSQTKEPSASYGHTMERTKWTENSNQCKDSDERNIGQVWKIDSIIKPFVQT